MEPTTVYLGVSLLFGMAHIVEAGLLWRSGGWHTEVTQGFAGWVIIWLIVSVAACRYLETSRRLPLAFTLYHSALLSFTLARRHAPPEAMSRGRILGGALFGLLLAGASGWLLATEPPSGDEKFPQRFALQCVILC